MSPQLARDSGGSRRQSETHAPETEFTEAPTPSLRFGVFVGTKPALAKGTGPSVAHIPQFLLSQPAAPQNSHLPASAPQSTQQARGQGRGQQVRLRWAVSEESLGLLPAPYRVLGSQGLQPHRAALPPALPRLT